MSYSKDDMDKMLSAVKEPLIQGARGVSKSIDKNTLDRFLKAASLAETYTSAPNQTIHINKEAESKFTKEFEEEWDE